MKRKVLSLRKTVTYLMTLALSLSYAAFPLLPVGLTVYAEEGTEEDDELIPIDAAHFPDMAFRDYVRDNFDADKDESLSKEERRAVENINLHDMGIKDLTGIACFFNLEKLSCYKNSLTELDVSRNTALNYLECGSNHLAKLDVSQNTVLQFLYCSNNQLTELDVSKNETLFSLNCAMNQLTALDVSENVWLTSLNCDYNQIASLDISNNSELQQLYCSNNNLSSLNASNNPKLGSTTFLCTNNSYFLGSGLTSLNLSELPGSFDAEKASNWEGADYADGRLTNFSGSGKITYRYQISGNKKEIFTLTYTNHVHSFQNHKCTSCGAIEICKENFPDEVFRDYILRKCDTVKDQALMEDEIAAVKEISVAAQEITDLTGLAYFTALTNLRCYTNHLTTLDVSKNTALTSLNCGGNQLTALDVSKNENLTTLNCSGNQLTTLDVSKNPELFMFFCADNQLQNLDVSKNGKLMTLDCSDNLLTSVDISANSELYSLYCNRNHLAEIDTRENRELRTLQCAETDISYLFLEQNPALEFLDCTGLGLTELDVSNNGKLRGLDCKDNALTSLDLSKNKNLQELNCSRNALTSLDLSGNTELKSFVCKDNAYYIGCTAESFDLSVLPGNYDSDKAGGWSGADYANGKLTNFSGNHSITYSYDTGYAADGEQSVTFSLVYGEHKFVKNTDEKYFKAPGTCTAGATYYYSCEFCGTRGEETFEAGTPSGHTWDAGRMTKLPTRTVNGIKTYTCTSCAETRSEEVEAAKGVTKIEIQVGEKTFPAVLYTNSVANAFLKKLPLMAEMKERNGNGKQYDFTTPFSPIASEQESIQAGDIMLLGDRSLVLFYADCQPSEEYTPLGYIENAAGLSAALGEGNATVTIRLAGTKPDDPIPGIRYWGDVDGKDGVTVYDALLILLHLADKQPITDKVNMIFADCDGKQGITVADALYILEVLADKREKKLYDGPTLNLKK